MKKSPFAVLLAAVLLSNSALASEEDFGLEAIPYVEVRSDYGFHVQEMPNDLPRYPGDIPNGPYKKLIFMGWNFVVRSTDSSVEIEKLELIAKSNGGSKRLVFVTHSLNEHVGNFSSSGNMPLRCISSNDGMVTFDLMVSLRLLRPDGSIEREAHPRRFVSQEMPPFVSPSEAFRGGMNRLCERN